MQKTAFAGLTELDVSESILEDNGAFTGRDRETIDRFLQIGAKTHRHDGSAGLSNPTNAPSGAVVASGGTIAADLNLNIGYTAQDEQRGETILSPVATVSTPGPLTEPQHAPSAEVKYDAGNLTQDNYYYGISYVDAEGGETPLGPVVIATRQPGNANARVRLSHINDGMAGAGATAWRLYRQRAGGVFAFLASGTSAEYLDEGNVSPVCDINPPNDNFNTTNSVNTLTVTLPSKANLPSGTAYINLYLSQSGSFTGQTFLEQFPVASAGQTIVYRSLELQDDQPPDVNTSIGGASKITLSEIEGLQWKAPVSGSANLGSGEKGDVKLVTSTGQIYGVLVTTASAASQWTNLASGGTSSTPGLVGLWTPEVTTGVKQITPTSFEKSTVTAEEGQVYSAESYTGGCYLTFRVSQTNKGLGFGLNVDPKTDSGFAGIDYFLNCTAAGTVLIRENGTEVGTFGSYVTGDTFAITYNGRKVRYWKNGEVLREVSRSIGEPLFLDSWWNNQGGKVTEVNFGPMASSPPALVASGASGVPGAVNDVEKLTFAGSGIAVKTTKTTAGEANILIGPPTERLRVTASGGSVNEVETLEVAGSGGIRLEETSPASKNAKVLVEGDRAKLGQEGVGTIRITTAEKGIPRPNTFRTYIWFCKVKPTNMAEFDIWIEEGP